MKLKLDENFDTRLVPELLKEGFDADSVIAEGLAGSPDEVIYETCKSVDRTLVTIKSPLLVADSTLTQSCLRG